MVFEVRQGRACKNLAAAQSIEINRLEAELVHAGQAIRIQKDLSKNYELVIAGFPKEIQRIEAIYQEKEKKLKAKIRKMWVWITVEGGIVVLILLL